MSEEYFKGKIERAVAFYDERARLINAEYLKEVEKLAARTDDTVLADFFRRTMRPGRIALELENIRMKLELGQVVEADIALETLKNRIHYVESKLRSRVFNIGLQFLNGPRRPRVDELTRLIDDALERLGKEATAEAVLSDIRAAPKVQEISDDKTIFWLNKSNKEKTTTFKALQNRLAERRKVFNKIGKG